MHAGSPWHLNRAIVYVTNNIGVFPFFYGISKCLLWKRSIMRQAFFFLHSSVSDRKVPNIKRQLRDNHKNAVHAILPLLFENLINYFAYLITLGRKIRTWRPNFPIFFHFPNINLLRICHWQAIRCFWKSPSNTPWLKAIYLSCWGFNGCNLMNCDFKFFLERANVHEVCNTPATCF